MSWKDRREFYEGLTEAQKAQYLCSKKPAAADLKSYRQPVEEAKGRVSFNEVSESIKALSSVLKAYGLEAEPKTGRIKAMFKRLFKALGYAPLEDFARAEENFKRVTAMQSDDLHRLRSRLDDLYTAEDERRAKYSVVVLDDTRGYNVWLRIKKQAAVHLATYQTKKGALNYAKARAEELGILSKDETRNTSHTKKERAQQWS